MRNQNANFRFIFFVLFLLTGFSSCKDDLTSSQQAEIDNLLTNQFAFDIKVLDSLYSQYPESDYLIGMKALGLIQSSKITEAQEFLGLSGNSPGTFTLMAEGVLLLHLKDSSRASEKLEKALVRDVEKSNKWLRLSLFYSNRSDSLDLAISYLKQAIKIDQYFNAALIELSYLYSPVEDCDTIINTLSRVNQRYLDYGFLTFFGDALYYCGQDNEARSKYMEANAIKNNGYSYFGLAAISHYVDENYAAAEENYSKAIEFEESKCHASIGLAWLYYDSNDFKKAELVFKESLELCNDLEFLSEFILFALKTKNIPLVIELNKKLEKEHQIDYMVRGYELTIMVLRGENVIDSEVNDYGERFGPERTKWLNSVFQQMGLPKSSNY